MNAAWTRGRRRRRVVFDAAVLFVIVLLMTQMWLLTATLESYLAGHHDAALPGLVMSAALAMTCLAIYRLLGRLDRTPDPVRESSQHGPWRIE